MIFVCLSTAISVVWIRHENRVAFSQIEDQFEERDRLNIEWYRLRLERAAISRFEQVESWAEDNAKLKKPQVQVVLLLPKLNKAP